MEKELLSSAREVTWSTRWTSWTVPSWEEGGSGFMRKARVGEGPGPGPDPGKTLLLLDVQFHFHLTV